MVYVIAMLILCNFSGCDGNHRSSSSSTPSLVVNGQGRLPSQQRTTRYHSAFVSVPVDFNVKNNRHQCQNKYHHHQQQQRQQQTNKKDWLDRKTTRFFHPTLSFATSSSRLWLSLPSTETEDASSSPSPHNSISDTSIVDDEKPKFTIRKCEYSGTCVC